MARFLNEEVHGLDDLALVILKRSLVALVAAPLFLLKSLLVNLYAVVLTVAFGLLGILAVPMRVYNYIKFKNDGTSKGSTFKALFFASLGGLGGLIVLPLLACALTLTCLGIACFDVIYQPMRGLYIGFKEGFGSMLKKFTAMGDNDGSELLKIANPACTETNTDFSEFSSFLTYENRGYNLAKLCGDFLEIIFSRGKMKAKDVEPNQQQGPVSSGGSPYDHDNLKPRRQPSVESVKPKPAAVQEETAPSEAKEQASGEKDEQLMTESTGNCQELLGTSFSC